MATNDNMSKYDNKDLTDSAVSVLGGMDNVKDLAEVGALGAGGYGALQYSTYRAKKAKLKRKDINLRKAALNWKIADEDLLAARAHSYIIKEELQRLQGADSSDKKSIFKAEKEVKLAEKKIDSILEKRELKKLFKTNPNSSASRIQDDYKSEKKRLASDKEYFKTDEGKSVKASQDARTAKLKNTPKATSRKIGLPINRMKGLAGSAVMGGISYLGTGGLRNYYDETADDVRRRSDKYKGEVTKDAEQEADSYSDVADRWDFLNDYSGYGTAVAGGALLGTQIGNRINAKYNVGRYGPNADPGGMNNWESLNQFRKDIGGAVAAPFKRAGTLGKRYNPIDGVSPERAADIYDYDVEQLNKAKEKRFTDPKMEEYTKFNTDLEDRLIVEANEKARFEKADRPVNSGIKNSITAQMDTRIDDLKRAIQQSKDILNKSTVTGSASVVNLTSEKERLKGLEGKLNTLDTAKRSLQKELDYELESDPKLIKKYAKHINSGAAKTGKWSVADKTLFKANSVIVGADKASETVKETVKEVAKEGTEKAKGFFGKTADKFNDLTGRNKSPDVDTSKILDTSPESMSRYDRIYNKQGRLGKTALGTSRAAGKGLGLVSVGQMGWGAGDIMRGAYDTDDIGKYASDLGDSARETLYQMPQAIADEALEYVELAEQGKYGEAGFKALNDFVLNPGTQTIKALGNIAMGIGEGIGLYDRAPGFWDMEAEGFKTLDDRGRVPLSKVRPASTENDANYDEVAKTKQRNEQIVANNAIKKEQAIATKRSAIQTQINKMNYGGFNTAQEYADKFGVEAMDGSDGRHYGTQVYKGLDEFGNVSYSDSPAAAMDPAKYDQVAGQAANKARQQFVKFKNAVKAKVKRDARGPAWANTPDEVYAKLSDSDIAKGNLQHNVASARNAREAAKEHRDYILRLEQDLKNPATMEGTKNFLGNRFANGPVSRQESDVSRRLLADQVEQSSWKTPGTSAPNPYDPNTSVTTSGDWRFFGDSDPTLSAQYEINASKYN